MSRVIDAIDVETFFRCKDEEEAKELAHALAQEMNLKLSDLVFVEHQGYGARVRLRGYIHRPGDSYQWLE
jgi:hypothetical protein